MTNEQYMAIRRALWVAHDKRCPYCGEHINWAELECEHVIPRSLNGAGGEWKKILEHFKLPPDYSLDALDNLLPAHRRCNQQKRNHAEIGYLTHFRLLASRKTETVRRLIEEHREADNLDDHIASLTQWVNSGLMTPEEVYDSLSGPAEPFKNVTNMESNPIQLSRSRVLFHCRLPSVVQPEGQLTITFRHVELRSMQLNIEHEDIVRVLFRSRGGPPSPRYRSFISKQDAHTQNCIVELVGASFPLNDEEIKQFCECIDLLEPLYLGAFRQVEEAISGAAFELTRAGDYRLQRIPRALWALMLEFANKHDISAGKSNWHVFDRNNTSIRAVWRTGTDWGYLGMVYAERESESGFLDKPDDKVWLCWSLSDYKMLRDDREEGKIWDVSEAAAFASQLTPQVLEWAGKQGLDTMGIPEALKEECRWDDESGEVSFGSKQVSKRDFLTAGSSVKWFQRMQTHYSSLCHDFVPHSVVDAIVRFILVVMEELPCPAAGIEYFFGNVEGTWKRGAGTPRARVEQRRLELLNATAWSGDEADHCLRSLGWWLEGTPEDRLRSFSFEKHFALFEPLVTHFNQTRYLARLQCWPHELR